MILKTRVSILNVRNKIDNILLFLFFSSSRTRVNERLPIILFNGTFIIITY